MPLVALYGRLRDHGQHVGRDRAQARRHRQPDGHRGLAHHGRAIDHPDRRGLGQGDRRHYGRLDPDSAGRRSGRGECPRAPVQGQQEEKRREGWTHGTHDDLQVDHLPGRCYAACRSEMLCKNRVSKSCVVQIPLDRHDLVCADDIKRDLSAPKDLYYRS